MQQISHANIVHLHEIMISSNNYYLVLDYCNRGDFCTFLRQRGARFLEEPEAVWYLKQIMNGFQVLRNKKIIHRDFKLSNLLVHDDILKIGDFGMAKRGREVAKTVVGTQMTMAPEMLMLNGECETKHYTSKADLWSIGVVYYQMLFGDPPYFGLSPGETLSAIKRFNAKPNFPRKISGQSQSLILGLLQFEPVKRISWSEFFNHELFASRPPQSLRELSHEQADDFSDNVNLAVDENIDIEGEFSKNKK